MKKENGLVLESFVEEITNSSTVIYTFATDNAVDLLKQFLQDMLDELGTNKLVDDVYDIQVNIDDMDIFVESIISRYGDDEFEGIQIPNYNDIDGCNKTARKIKTKLQEMLNNGTTNPSKIYKKYDIYHGTNLIVTSKATGKILNINNLIGAEEFGD